MAIVFLGNGLDATTIMGHATVHTGSGVVEVSGYRARKLNGRWVSSLEEEKVSITTHISGVKVLWL